MRSIKLDFEDDVLNRMTVAGLKSLVKKILTSSEEEEASLMKRLSGEKNDLADLDEEMHGKPNAPEVTEEDLPGDGELADVPKKKGKK